MTLNEMGARPPPDPEVAARPKRRQFTAEYRLRILEEADRCTQPGEVGRPLRREGLDWEHLRQSVLPLRVATMTWRLRIERARRSMRVTTSVSPGWIKSRMVPSS